MFGPRGRLSFYDEILETNRTDENIVPSVRDKKN